MITLCKCGVIDGFQGFNVNMYTFSYASTEDGSNCLTSKKYIVYEEQILKLFISCSKCGAVTDNNVYENGSMIIIHQQCSNCCHTLKWNSQPFINNIPAGNIAISASILFSSNAPSPVIRFLTHLNCKAISETTFYHQQQQYLFPTINAVWAKHRDILGNELRGKYLRLGGDGRLYLFHHNYILFTIIKNCHYKSQINS